MGAVGGKEDINHGTTVCEPQGRVQGEPCIAHSFVATTNKKAFKAQKVRSEPIPLTEILLRNKTMHRAFNNEEDLASRSGKNTEQVVPEIIQHSGGVGVPTAVPAYNGLVSAICNAYNTHHELVLRPDDVWQAINTQFSFYVNKNAEELRDIFVDFQGKKQLVITAAGTLFTADFGSMAKRMVDEQIVNNIKDPSIAAWLLPCFSTTMPNDRIAGSVTVMSTLQAYFEYKFCLMCGIPRVTLLGTVDDWKRLRAKADRLPEFDLGYGHMKAWHGMLSHVLDQFVRAAKGNPDIGFWDRVCSHHGGGSGPSFLSGWVTVFCVFTEKGEWQGQRGGRSQGFRVGGLQWPQIDTEDLPNGVVSVPVLVDDNGVEYETQMLAGQFGFSALKDGTAIQPRTDWCIAYNQKVQVQEVS